MIENQEQLREENPQIETVEDAADAILGMMGDDSDEGPEGAPAEAGPPPSQDPPKFKVKVDGEEVEVDLEELKRGYSRQSDYTRKTQALAEQRQQVEAQQAHAQQHAAQWQAYVSAIPQLHSVAETNILQAQNALQSPEMVRLAQEDPAEYLARRAQLEQNIAQNAQAIQQMRQHHTQFSQQQEMQKRQWAAETVQRGDEVLKQTIPNWGPETKQALAQYAVERLGYSAEELSQLFDPRAVQVLWRAAQFDRLVSNMSRAKEKADKAPRFIEPGSRNTSREGYSKTLDRVRKSGRVEDAAAAIAGLL